MTRPKVPTPPPVTGWREWIALPDLGIDRIKAKIDTGARTSALHAFDVERHDIDGIAQVRFFVHPLQRRRHPSILCSAPLIDERIVTSSNGKPEHRYVIETTLQLGIARWPIEITLTNRDEMTFRMLLGRQAVRGHCLVDPGTSFRMSHTRRRRTRHKERVKK